MEKNFVLFSPREEDSSFVYINVDEIEAFVDNRIFTKSDGRYSVAESRDEILKKIQEACDAK